MDKLKEDVHRYEEIQARKNEEIEDLKSKTKALEFMVENQALTLNQRAFCQEPVGRWLGMGLTMLKAVAEDTYQERQQNLEAEYKEKTEAFNLEVEAHRIEVKKQQEELEESMFTFRKEKRELREGISAKEVELQTKMAEMHEKIMRLENEASYAMEAKAAAESTVAELQSQLDSESRLHREHASVLQGDIKESNETLRGALQQATEELKVAKEELKAVHKENIEKTEALSHQSDQNLQLEDQLAKLQNLFTEAAKQNGCMACRSQAYKSPG